MVACSKGTQTVEKRKCDKLLDTVKKQCEHGGRDGCGLTLVKRQGNWVQDGFNCL